MVIAKFGGTSVTDAEAMRRVVRIIERQRAADGIGPVVVASALSRVTDQLVKLAELAERGDAESAARTVEALHRRHVEVAGVVEGPARRRLVEQIDRGCADLGDFVKALAVIREVSPRSLDALLSVGELLSSRMLTAALAGAGVPATWFDARRVLVTDAAHTCAVPAIEATGARLRSAVVPALESEQVPVVGGFVGSTAEGVTTTLGRGGSDYSAAVIGACLDASEIQIWTDVDGMLTADPRVVDHPKLVRWLSFAEASELAYFGAKVLHPSTIQPAVARSIPVRILNSLRPEGAGTLITEEPSAGPAPITAIACKREVTVIEITSTRMLMAHGFLRRLFEIFDRFGTPVDVVTTSEVSVSVTVDDRRRLRPLLDALAEFADVSCDHEMALVCVVGERLRTDPTLFTQVVSALDRTSLRMVSQAASRRNITFVLRQADLAAAMTRLHERFFGEEPVGLPQARNA